MADSIGILENQLPSLQGESRLEALNNLAKHFVVRDNHRALAFALEARDLAVELGADKCLADSLLQMGKAQFWLNHYDDSKSNVEQALALFESHNDQLGQARAMMSLGNVYFRQALYSKSLEYYLTAHATCQTLEFKQEEGRCLNNLGMVHADLGDYATALEYYLQAFNIAQANENTTQKDTELEFTAVICANIGETLKYMERWSESLEYCQKALQIAQEISYKNFENISLTRIGEIYVYLKQYEQALSLLEESLALSRNLGDRQREIQSLSLLGKVHASLSNYELAAQCYEQGLALSHTLKNPKEELSLQLNFADYLIKFNDLPTAFTVLQQVIESSEQKSLKTEACQARSLLATAYEQAGDYEQALSHYKQFNNLKQSLHGEKQDKRAEAFTVRHEVEKARQVAEAQRALNEELQRTNQELAESYRQNQELLQQVQYQAQHDVLTRLPNRNLFEDRLQQAVASAARYNQNFAVMFIDLDGFKLVNDALGHDAGDELLVQVAKRFRNALRESDTVARFGGDEFTVIAHNIYQAQDAAVVANKLLKSLQTPFEIRGRKVSVGASIGISLYPQDGQDVVTLQKHADVAMYHVKHGSKCDVRFYSPGMNAAAVERVLLETQLRGALEREELTLHYQPQFNARTNQISGFEALLRWTDAKIGAVSPDKFISIAEDTGLISVIGKWVLNEACRQISLWRRDGHQIHVAVNVSPLQFAQNDFTQTVVDILNQHELPPEALELELTERIMLRDPDLIAIKLTELRTLGVRVAIDDFGTGHSILTNILQLPINTLKVDKAFVKDVDVSPEIRKVVQAIVALSRTMGLMVVAEGVETQDQLTFLRELGCERTQGYLQGRPMPSESAINLLNTYQAEKWSSQKVLENA